MFVAGSNPAASAALRPVGKGLETGFILFTSSHVCRYMVSKPAPFTPKGPSPLHTSAGMWGETGTFHAMKKPNYYIQDNHIADIVGPIVRLTSRGCQAVSLYQVKRRGQTVFTAPTEQVCQQWLYQQGFFPR